MNKLSLFLIILTFSILMSGCVRVGLRRQWYSDAYHCASPIYSSDIIIID